MSTAIRYPFAVPAARASVRRGLAVFPIPAWGRVPSPGWQRLATRDEATLPTLFADGQNIGVACRASNIVVLDLDRHATGPDGVTGWKNLCATNGADGPDTFTVLTPHGGLHLYFQAPAGAVITSSSGLRPGFPPGIDVRAPGQRTGGYVLGPGSQVKDGRYKVARDAPIQPLPGWVTSRLAREE